MIELRKYVGLEWGKPYDCYTLVVEVRKDLGLDTPTLYEPSTTENVIQIGQHARSELWFERPNLYLGLIGDVVTMSQINSVEAHHLGVVISSADILHVDFERTVSLLPLARIYRVYPGKTRRWGTAPWELGNIAS